MTDSSKPAVASKPAKPTQPKPWLNWLSLGIILLLIVGLYYHGHQASQVFQLQTTSLAEQIQQSQAQSKNDLQAIQQQSIQAAQQQQATNLKQQQRLEKLLAEAELSRNQALTQLDLLRAKDNQQWQLFEAEHLIKIAAQKIWLEQDIQTAILILQQADYSIASIDDPYLIPLRKAIALDLKKLKDRPQIDRLGLTLKLDALLDSVQNLSVANIELPAIVEEGETSSSLSQWQQSLLSAWHNFREQFITVRRREGATDALLAPQQDWYLRQNLSLQISQAQQAIMKQQDQLYQQKLARSQQWISDYFTHNQLASALQTQLKELSQQSIVESDLPELSSLSAVQKALQQREQRLLRDFKEPQS